MKPFPNRFVNTCWVKFQSHQSLSANSRQRCIREMVSSSAANESVTLIPVASRKDFCTSWHKQSPNLLVQFSRALSTQNCSKTYGLNEAWKATGREDGKSLGLSDFLLWNHASSSALLVWQYVDLCAKYGEKHLPRLHLLDVAQLNVLHWWSSLLSPRWLRATEFGVLVCFFILLLTCVSKNMGLFMQVSSLTALLWSGEAQACRT